MFIAAGFPTIEAERPKREPQSDVPAAVLQELRSRGCKIAEKKPKNIIYGELIKLGQTDWVALCSAESSTSLLIFPQGASEHALLLETHPKGFSNWAISTTEPEKLKALKAAWGWRGPESADIDHEGINSVVSFGHRGNGLYRYSEQQAIHYHHQDHWFIPMQIMIN
jgi:hypothetical protein